MERVPIPDSFPTDKKDWTCLHPRPRTSDWRQDCQECRHIPVDEIPHVFLTYIWECEGCGTTTLVASKGGHLNPCECDPALMTVGWTAAGQYRHMGYACDLAGMREHKAA